VMGIFSASSINASNTNTSSTHVNRLLVGINRPPFLRNGIYAAYKTVRTLIVRDRMTCFVLSLIEISYRPRLITKNIVRIGHA
jgi:hypothetical protein